jgi:hypothetical protein
MFRVLITCLLRRLSFPYPLVGFLHLTSGYAQRVATRTAHRKRAPRGEPLSKRVRDTYELWSRLPTEHELMTCASGISFKVIVSSISLAYS